MRTLNDLEKNSRTNIKHTENIFEWSFNLTTNQYTCSGLFLEVCGISVEQFNPHDFLILVHPDHRNKVRQRLSLYAKTASFNEKFPILTKYGYRWLLSELTEQVIAENGEVIAKGHLEFLSDTDVLVAKDAALEFRMNELIDRYTSVSASLMDLLNKSDISTAMIKVLDSLVDDLGGDRAYVFEYNMEQKTQSCVYEVDRNSVEPKKEKLQNIPIHHTKWWPEMLIDKAMPVVCDNIEELPEEEYKILKSQNIQSLIVVPLVTKHGIGGYLGIDMVGRTHTWSDIDKQWFRSIANIIGLSIELKKSEEIAQRERARYIDLYERMPIGCMRVKLIYDKDGIPVDYIYMEVNPVAQQIIKASFGEIAGKMASSIDGAFSEKYLAQFDAIVKTKEVRRGNIFVDDINCYFDYTAYAVEKDELVILMLDSTASVVTNRALRKSQETLSNIYKNIPVGIEIYDKDGFLVSINEMEKEIFGCQSEESVLGVNLFENPNVPFSFLVDLKNNKPSWCDFFYDFDKLDNYYSTSRTGKKHIILKGSILYDADNNVENYLLIVLDNTDHLEASHKIHEFEVLFNSIAEFAEVGFAQWNPAEKRIVGTEQWYENLSLRHRQVNDIMDAYVNAHEDDAIRIQAGFQDILDGKITYFREEIRIKEGNDWKWLRCNYKLVDYGNDDERIEIIGINIDITELKNTELKLIESKLRAEESDRLKSAFLANMSHEIRTPLNAIVGFSDLLVEADDISDRQQYVSIIQQNNEILLQLISDILDISKIESGTLDLRPQFVNINAVCREVVELHSLNLDRDVTLLFEENEEECFIISDRNRLTQVLNNLVGNSLKFTSQGTVSIGYTIQGDDVEFYVRDTGIGISANQLSSVFNRFVKLNNFASGTGLGLPICRSIVEKMNGRIWAESEIGVGTCFKFILPYDNRNGQEGDVSPYYTNKLNLLKNKEMEDDKPTILVAEDTDSNYLLVSTILKHDYNLIRAYNGIEAVQLFEAHAPKLILMDMKMPEMDGVEATRRIRKIDKEIPIIMLTAFAYDDDKNLALEVGCCDFMTKPIHPSELQRMIKKYI